MIKTEAYNESKQFLGLTKKNGVKAGKLYTQKPLGSFSVSRNLPAYRTNQEGVLELMGANVPRIDYPITILEPSRTNLILYSQEFNNAAWGKSTTTVTANAAIAPDGTLTADRVQGVGASAIDQTITTTVTNYVYSFWVKSYSGINQTFRARINGGVTGNLTATSIWQRMEISATGGGANTWGFLRDSSDNNYDVLIWGAQLETGNTATAYIPTTNAPVTVPDVIEAGCPELLVENEATNRILQSQTADNASWFKDRISISANTINAPDDTLTADTIVENTANGQHGLSQFNVNITNGDILTMSIYVKFNGRRYILLQDPYSGNGAFFDILNGVVLGTVVSALDKKIEYIRNGWYRCSVTHIGVGATSGLQTVLSQNGISVGYTGDGSSGVYIWGAQLEKSNKATSYIPTTTTVVTRPADNVRNNTIGYDNEESTIFVRARLNFTTNYQGIATLWDGDDIYNGYITMYYYISGGVRYIAFDTYNGFDTNQYLYTAPSDGVYSIAFAYNTDEGSYKIAINGVLITDDAFPNDFPSYTLLTQMTLGSFLTYFNSRTKGFMYFDSMLDNDSLENLTVQ
jgi:hypothetical protein